MRAIVVMGVSGCGKSSVAAACASALHWTLIEGDDHHAPASREKMRAGTPLDDADRSGWLQTLGGLLAAELDAGRGAVLSCSALKRGYRRRLREAAPGLGFAWLRIDEDVASARVASRGGHFFAPTLVASQFAALEPPAGEPGVLVLDAQRPLAELREQVVDWVLASTAA